MKLNIVDSISTFFNNLHVIISSKHMFLFWGYYVSYFLILIRYPMGSNIAQIRYFILLICILYEIVSLIKLYGLKFYKKTRYNELLFVIPLGALFFLKSIFVAFFNDHSIFFRTYVQIFLLISPFIYTFCLLNLEKDIKIIGNLKYLMFAVIFLYFAAENHTLLDFFDFSNYKTISGQSFTESSLFSDVFLQLFLLFNYLFYISKRKFNIISKRYVFITAFFVLLCNKRLAMAIIIITPLLNLILNKDINLFAFFTSKRFVLFVTLCFSVATVVYFKTLNYEWFTNFDVYSFSTGRDYILSLWRNLNFVSYGFGSSMVLIGRYLELDLIQIYLELGFMCLFVFLFFFFYISYKNIYTLIVMIYCMLNMLTASSLPNTFGWILTILIVKLIENYQSEVEFNE